MRTQRWRYTEWGPDGERGIELYDHDSDSQENVNLAADPRYAKVVAELRPRLHKVSRPGFAGTKISDVTAGN
jgi:iduronate 2-sulfatase